MGLRAGRLQEEQGDGCSTTGNLNWSCVSGTVPRLLSQSNNSTKTPPQQILKATLDKSLLTLLPPLATSDTGEVYLCFGKICFHLYLLDIPQSCMKAQSTEQTQTSSLLPADISVSLAEASDQLKNHRAFCPNLK